MKRQFQIHVTLCVAVIILMAIFSVAHAGSYTRDDAHQYLRNTILGPSVYGIECWGSQCIVPFGTTVICGNDTLPTATYDAWLFVVDFNIGAFWSHPVDVYFIDINNLSNWISYPAFNLPDNVDMDMLDKDWLTGSLNTQVDFQPGDIIPAAPTDDHLKALLIVPGYGGDEGYELAHLMFYHDAQRWYVMLKALGYKDENIRALVTDGTDPTEELAWYHPDDDPEYDLPTYSNNEPDLDRDGDDDIDGAATLANVTAEFTRLAENCHPDDRITIYISSHGGWVGRRIYPEDEFDPSKYKLALWPSEGFSPSLYPTDLCTYLSNITEYAELNVFIETCCAGFWFPLGVVGETYEDLEHTHLYASGIPNLEYALSYADWDLTYELYGTFTLLFTSEVLGYLPWVDERVVRQRGENQYAWYTVTEPWRRGEELEYTIW